MGAKCRWSSADTKGMGHPSPRPEKCSNCPAEGLTSPFCPHCGAPTYTPSYELVAAPAAAAVAPPRGDSPGTAFLAKSNALFQSINATAFGGLVVGWMAIGASLAGATTAACVFCIAVPIIGWFIGLPVVLSLAMAGAAVWITGLLCCSPPGRSLPQQLPPSALGISSRVEANRWRPSTDGLG